MPNCAVATCDNYNQKTKGKSITYHTFPKDPAVCKLWILACKRGDVINVKHARVCSAHFNEDDYVRDLKSELLGLQPKKLLKPGSVPSLNLISGRTPVPVDDHGNSHVSTLLPSQDTNNEQRITRTIRYRDRETRKRAINRLFSLSPIKKEKDAETETEPFNELSLEEKLRKEVCLLKCKNERLEKRSSTMEREDHIKSEPQWEVSTEDNYCAQSLDVPAFSEVEIKPDPDDLVVPKNEPQSTRSQNEMEVATVECLESDTAVCKDEDLWNDIPAGILSSAMETTATARASITDPSNGKMFECKLCREVFPNGVDLRLHNCNSTDKPFHCRICAKSFSTAHYLKVHQNRHTNFVRYSCSVCGNSFTELPSLKKHMLLHSGTKAFKCKLCNMEFTYSGNLKAHLRVHMDERKYECNICLKKFRRQHDLSCHMPVHTGEKYFSCDICGKSFVQRGHLKSHMFIHTRASDFKCTICNKSFPHKYVLDAHIQSHTGQRNFKCPYCDRQYMHIRHLRRHIPSHSGERFHCLLCGNNYSSQEYLSKHVRRKHEGKTESEVFECSDCGKCFMKLSYLRKHIVIHTGEKRFVCNICNKAFSQSGNRSKHLRVHRTESLK